MSDVDVVPETKPGRHPEATLYRALDRAGSPLEGRTLEEVRAQALELADSLELPTWRRSGFWTTSLRDLPLDELSVPLHEDVAVPDIVSSTFRDKVTAGMVVQRGGSVVHAELRDDLRERGVILCSLEDAAREHAELFSQWYRRRLTSDRNKLEALCAGLWTGGAFLYVPPDVVVEEPFVTVYVIDEPGSAQYAHTLAIGDRGSQFRLQEYDLGTDFEGPALHAGAFELYLQDDARCRLTHFQDWGSGEVYDVSTHFVGVGRDAFCHWLPSVLGGHLTRQHLELAVSEPGGDMAFRGVFFTEGEERLDNFAVDLHETGPSEGDVHWRGVATGSSRASFEGLIKINPGAQRTHTYLQIHTMMLSDRARLDAIPSVLVSADDVSASHGGTVGELDQALVFYMQSRGLDRATAVRVIVDGFFEPLIAELQDEHLEALVRERINAKLQRAAHEIERYATSR